VTDPIPGLDAGREALRRYLVGLDDRETMLQAVANLAVDTIPGADVVRITLVVRDRPTTPVFTEDAAFVLDAAQYELDDGPCLAAMRHRDVERVDTASDERWPLFTAAARQLEITGAMGAALVRGEGAVGSLNVYSRSMGTFDDGATGTASLFADQLGVAAAHVVLLSEGYDLAGHLQQAMESRAVIEQAKGIVMALSNIDSDAAFDVLRRASQRSNRKLRSIAADIVARYTTEKSG
jgi:GAF domain-containing protein